MKISRRKLNRKLQIKLLEILIAEAVADLWGNTKKFCGTILQEDSSNNYVPP